MTAAMVFLLAGRVPPQVRPWLVGLAVFDLTVGAGFVAWQARPRAQVGHAARWVWPALRGVLVALLSSARVVPLPEGADDLEVQLARVTRFAPHLSWLRAAAFEILTLRLALRRRVPTEGPAFPSTSGADGMFLLMGALIVLEAVPVHVLLAGRSGLLAALHLLGSVLGLLWVVGQVRACRERITTVTGDALLVRCGLFWNARVPLAVIAGARAAHPDDHGARVSVNVQPNVTVSLRRPVTLLGAGGRQTPVDALRLHVDDPRALLAALAAARR